MARAKRDVDACLIPLTKGYVAIVDRKNYEWLNQWTWRVRFGGQDNNVYAICHPRVNGHKFYVAMHQLIVGDVPEGQVIHHKNGIGIDNRLCNLLVGPKGLSVTMRSSRPLGKFSRFRGVYLEAQTQDGRMRWRAGISINGRFVGLGLYDDDVEAAIARDKEAVRHYGPHAYVNFPEKMAEYLAYARQFGNEELWVSRRLRRQFARHDVPEQETQGD